MPPKQKIKAHIIGFESVKVLESLLPSHWSVREYHPDYGLDLAIEVFETPSTNLKGHTGAYTLGEHFFVQVKGTERLVTQKLEVQPRYNVEVLPQPLPVNDGI